MVRTDTRVYIVFCPTPIHCPCCICVNDMYKFKLGTVHCQLQGCQFEIVNLTA